MGHLGLYRTIWRPGAFPRASPGHSQEHCLLEPAWPYGTISGHMKTYGDDNDDNDDDDDDDEAIWSHMRPYGAICSLMGPSEAM